jgi:hypothetical protein
MIPEVASVQEIHDQVHIISVLECIVHVDNERIVELSEYLTLIHDRFQAPLGENPRLGHFLHGVWLFRLLALNFPHFAKTSLPNAILVVKVILRKSYNNRLLIIFSLISSRL